MTVILIDDDPQVLEVLRELVQRRGYEVMTYDSPMACPLYTSTLASCASEYVYPNIVISDVDMPNVNGMDFIEKVYQNGYKDIRYALLTGKGIEKVNLSRMAKFGTRFFEKPLDFTEFDAWLMHTG